MTSLADRQLEEWKAAVGKLGRVPEEWIGKTADSMPSGRVRDRILRTWGRCHLSKAEIRPGDAWDLEHVIPVSMGGMNAERNLRPALKAPHKAKTKQEAGERAKADRARRQQNGTKTTTAKPIQSAGFAKTERASKIARGGRIDKSALAPLPRRDIFTGEPIT